MIRKYRSAIIAVYALIVLIGVIWHAGGVSAQDTIKLKVNSQTTSTATMGNMKPGDQMGSNYTIINDGNEEFDYYVDFTFKSGDADLYQILQMTLKKEGVILYSGVMSEAAGRVAVGSLAGGEQESIEMDVTFPWEAGNEYQGKVTTVSFVFSASSSPGPSPSPSPKPSGEPSPTPSASATPEPSTGPSTEPSPSASAGPSGEPNPSPSASATPEPSATATAEPTSGPPTSPTATASPGIPGVIVTPGPSVAPTASPGPQDLTVTDDPVPLGGGDQGGEPAPSASPGAGGTAGGAASPAPSPSSPPDDGITLADDELPLSPPEDGQALLDTAGPWYNLILLSLAGAVICFIVLRRLKSKR